MIRIVDPASLKVWKLVDMEVLPTWINGRAALIGDAAHPFLPRESNVILLFKKVTDASIKTRVKEVVWQLRMR